MSVGGNLFLDGTKITLLQQTVQFKYNNDVTMDAQSSAIYKTDDAQNYLRFYLKVSIITVIVLRY
mgnify:CR=1 FL=1